MILVLNCGSSTLKFAVVDSGEGQPRVEDVVEGRDHAGAARAMLARLADDGVLEGVAAVGHRVVHGGDLTGPTVVDGAARHAIERATELAPLHNRPALSVLDVVLAELPGVPSVAVFDTAFHATLPERARRYAIPPALADRHGVRRYGFHGLAHRSMAEQYATISGRALSDVRLVTLQLGAGCSAAALAGGRSVDTSMGLTPLEGLMMSTRSGDVDPTLAGFLAHAEGVAIDEVEGWLNTRSGLLGISGRSGDVRDLLDAEAAGDESAALALEMFCYRARKQVGAYLAALGGADAVVFGGGIGEHATAIRARIAGGMQWCGLDLDPVANDEVVAGGGRISAAGSAIEAWVVTVDEASVIAADVAEAVGLR